MLGKKIPEISVDELMERIKAELRRRNIHKTEMVRPFPEPTYDFKIDLSPGTECSDPDFIPTPHSLEFKENGYHINEFLKYHDQDFVINAYRGILRRNPDPDGLEHFLKNLRSGVMTKPEILGRLCYSPEGKAKRVRVKGLALNFAIQSSFKIPVLGYLFHILVSVANIPAILRNLRTMETAAFAHLQHQGKYLNTVTETFRARTDELRACLRDVENTLEALRHAKVEIREFIALHRIVVELEEAFRRFLENSKQQISNPVTPNRIDETDGQASHFLDAFYALFEDRFRGTRQDIKGRLKAYLPFIQRAGAGTKDLPILDLGCGRGEWLELLKENDYTARGVDKNKLFVESCKDLELDILESDAVEYLRSLKADSYGAITGFQIAEHLSWSTLITLLGESLRVLKKGGIIILETPNPENLIVGSCEFYLDPTHKNPIPASTLQFLMEASGFVNVQESAPLKGFDRTGDAESEDFLGAWVSKPKDYAMIGSKAW